VSLRFQNTLTRRKEPFGPEGPGPVGMYVCGVTPYDHAHVGHARSAIVFDVVRRYLGFRGIPVTFVKNYTDVDDKIIARAAQAGEDPGLLAERFIGSYEEDMAALGVAPPDIAPRATQHIPDMVAWIERLLARGAAYAVEGDVYFAVRAFPAYGRLSGRALDDLRAGARVEVDERKRDPLDFALWKAAKPGEPSWESPWGHGRPGWHIECSAMSYRYLGAQIDIHGGGQDLIFPHHENEIAQSEAYTGKQPFVRFWVHNGLMRLPGAKRPALPHALAFEIGETMREGLDTARWTAIRARRRVPPPLRS
jgi:cysteinyl-tRNA synthetase